MNLGFDQEIDKLINSIPQNIKSNDFNVNHFYMRLNSYDIPYVCNNVSKMLTTGDNLIFYRKVLIVCKIILQKQEEAMLALELLDNDIESADKFVDKITNYLEIFKNKSLDVSIVNEMENHLLKILSFYNYDAAKTFFKETPIIFHKTIYDLSLFSKELQIESLEFLVNEAIYDPSFLIKEYNSYISEEELELFYENLNNNENSTKSRAAIFKIVTSTLSTIERAKALVKLWKFGEEKNIDKAISLITKDSTMSLSPDVTLNWFNLPATKALILSNELEVAKKWIFFGTSDFKERASIDIDFCRLLMLIYLYDSNITDNKGRAIDLKFFFKHFKK